MISRRLQLGVDVRLVGLQQLRLRRDGDRFAQRADLERDVDAGDLADRHRHVGAHRFPEPRQRDLDVVGPRQDVGQVVAAFGVGHGVAGEVRFLVDDGDGGARHDAALRILHDADNAAVENLGLGGDRHEHEARGGDEGDESLTQRTDTYRVTVLRTRSQHPPSGTRSNRTIDVQSAGRYCKPDCADRASAARTVTGPRDRPGWRDSVYDFAWRGIFTERQSGEDGSLHAALQTRLHARAWCRLRRDRRRICGCRTSACSSGSAMGMPRCPAESSAARQSSIVFCASNTLIEVSRPLSTQSTSSSISSWNGWWLTSADSGIRRWMRMPGRPLPSAPASRRTSGNGLAWLQRRRGRAGRRSTEADPGAASRGRPSARWNV